MGGRRRRRRPLLGRGRTSSARSAPPSRVDPGIHHPADSRWNTGPRSVLSLSSTDRNCAVLRTVPVSSEPDSVARSGTRRRGVTSRSVYSDHDHRLRGRRRSELHRRPHRACGSRPSYVHVTATVAPESSSTSRKVAGPVETVSPCRHSQCRSRTRPQPGLGLMSHRRRFGMPEIGRAVAGCGS